jgi:hypothetical protein
MRGAETLTIVWETIICGLPRTLTIMVSSRATRLPEIDVSGTAAKHA